jgi:hypothetical protein
MQFETQPLDPISLSLHENALASAKRFLVAEIELLDAIMAVDKQCIYEKFGFPALTPYCIKILRLSEEVAVSFVRVARKCEQVSLLRKALEERSITLFKAKAIASLLTPDNAPHWIQRASELSKEKLEDEIRAALGKGERKIKLRLSKEQFEKLERVRDLLSTDQEASWEDAVGKTLEFWLDRHDPVRKAERKATKSDNDRPRGRSPIKKLRLPSSVRHQVNRRDKGQCQARHPDGTKCENKRWVHFHHIVPKCDGGSDTAENIITLCSSHHRQWHARQERPPTSESSATAPQ